MQQKLQSLLISLTENMIMAEIKPYKITDCNYLIAA